VYRRTAFAAFALWLGVISGAAVAQEPPDFPEITLMTMDGSGKVGLDDFRGRPVLLSFWASWCGPCRIELPELQELYTELAGDGFVLLTVNLDDSPRLAARFMEQIGLSVPVYRMPRGQVALIGVSGLPTNILIDREGRPVKIYAGYSPDLAKEIRGLVLEMIGADGAGDHQSGS
jgi:thiol-disulfide isomerase/thioredoxin